MTTIPVTVVGTAIAAPLDERWNTMSRTRITLAAAVLATTALGVPAALAAPACAKPGAQQLHDVHDAGEAVPVAGVVVSGAAHEVEETYCAL
jgi:hypothetical protein